MVPPTGCNGRVKNCPEALRWHYGLEETPDPEEADKWCGAPPEYLLGEQPELDQFRGYSGHLEEAVVSSFKFPSGSVNVIPDWLYPKGWIDHVKELEALVDELAALECDCIRKRKEAEAAEQAKRKGVAEGSNAVPGSSEFPQSRTEGSQLMSELRNIRQKFQTREAPIQSRSRTRTASKDEEEGKEAEGRADGTSAVDDLVKYGETEKEVVKINQTMREKLESVKTRCADIISWHEVDGIDAHLQRVGLLELRTIIEELHAETDRDRHNKLKCIAGLRALLKFYESIAIETNRSVGGADASITPKMLQNLTKMTADEKEYIQQAVLADQVLQDIKDMTQRGQYRSDKLTQSWLDTIVLKSDLDEKGYLDETRYKTYQNQEQYLKKLRHHISRVKEFDSLEEKYEEAIHFRRKHQQLTKQIKMVKMYLESYLDSLARRLELDFVKEFKMETALLISQARDARAKVGKEVGDMKLEKIKLQRALNQKRNELIQAVNDFNNGGIATLQKAVEQKRMKREELRKQIAREKNKLASLHQALTEKQKALRETHSSMISSERLQKRLRIDYNIKTGEMMRCPADDRVVEEAFSVVDSETTEVQPVLLDISAELLSRHPNARFDKTRWQSVSPKRVLKTHCYSDVQHYIEKKHEDVRKSDAPSEVASLFRHREDFSSRTLAQVSRIEVLEHLFCATGVQKSLDRLASMAQIQNMVEASSKGPSIFDAQGLAEPQNLFLRVMHVVQSLRLRVRHRHFAASMGAVAVETIILSVLGILFSIGQLWRGQHLRELQSGILCHKMAQMIFESHKAPLYIKQEQLEQRLRQEKLFARVLEKFDEKHRIAKNMCQKDFLVYQAELVDVVNVAKRMLDHHKEVMSPSSQQRVDLVMYLPAFASASGQSCKEAQALYARAQDHELASGREASTIMRHGAMHTLKAAMYQRTCLQVHKMSMRWLHESTQLPFSLDTSEEEYAIKQVTTLISRFQSRLDGEEYFIKDEFEEIEEPPVELEDPEEDVIVHRKRATLEWQDLAKTLAVIDSDSDEGPKEEAEQGQPGEEEAEELDETSVNIGLAAAAMKAKNKFKLKRRQRLSETDIVEYKIEDSMDPSDLLEEFKGGPGEDLSDDGSVKGDDEVIFEAPEVLADAEDNLEDSLPFEVPPSHLFQEQEEPDQTETLVEEREIEGTQPDSKPFEDVLTESLVHESQQAIDDDLSRRVLYHSNLDGSSSSMMSQDGPAGVSVEFDALTEVNEGMDGGRSAEVTPRKIIENKELEVKTKRASIDEPISPKALEVAARLHAPKNRSTKAFGKMKSNQAVKWDMEESAPESMDAQKKAEAIASTYKKLSLLDEQHKEGETKALVKDLKNMRKSVKKGRPTAGRITTAGRPVAAPTPKTRATWAAAEQPAPQTVFVDMFGKVQQNLSQNPRIPQTKSSIISQRPSRSPSQQSIDSGRASCDEFRSKEEQSKIHGKNRMLMRRTDARVPSRHVTSKEEYDSDQESEVTAFPSNVGLTDSAFPSDVVLSASELDAVKQPEEVVSEEKSEKEVEQASFGQSFRAKYRLARSSRRSQHSATDAMCMARNSISADQGDGLPLDFAFTSTSCQDSSRSVRASPSEHATCKATCACGKLRGEIITKLLDLQSLRSLAHDGPGRKRLRRLLQEDLSLPEHMESGPSRRYSKVFGAVKRGRASPYLGTSVHSGLPSTCAGHSFQLASQSTWVGEESSFDKFMSTMSPSLWQQYSSTLQQSTFSEGLSRQAEFELNAIYASQSQPSGYAREKSPERASSPVKGLALPEFQRRVELSISGKCLKEAQQDGSTRTPSPSSRSLTPFPMSRNATPFPPSRDATPFPNSRNATPLPVSRGPTPFRAASPAMGAVQLDGGPVAHTLVSSQPPCLHHPPRYLVPADTLDIEVEDRLRDDSPDDFFEDEIMRIHGEQLTGSPRHGSPRSPLPIAPPMTPAGNESGLRSEEYELDEKRRAPTPMSPSTHRKNCKPDFQAHRARRLLQRPPEDEPTRPPQESFFVYQSSVGNDRDSTTRHSATSMVLEERPESPMSSKGSTIESMDAKSQDFVANSVSKVDTTGHHDMALRGPTLPSGLPAPISRRHQGFGPSRRRTPPPPSTLDLTLGPTSTTDSKGATAKRCLATSSDEDIPIAKPTEKQELPQPAQRQPQRKLLDSMRAGVLGMSVKIMQMGQRRESRNEEPELELEPSHQSIRKLETSNLEESLNPTQSSWTKDQEEDNAGPPDGGCLVPGTEDAPPESSKASDSLQPCLNTKAPVSSVDVSLTSHPTWESSDQDLWMTGPSTRIKSKLQEPELHKLVAGQSPGQKVTEPHHVGPVGQNWIRKSMKPGGDASAVPRHRMPWSVKKGQNQAAVGGKRIVDLEDTLNSLEEGCARLDVHFASIEEDNIRIPSGTKPNKASRIQAAKIPQRLMKYTV